MRQIYLILGLVSLVFLAGCATEPAGEPVELSTEEIEMGIQVTTDGVKYIVNPDKIRGGGPPKDGIPSIDDPNFVTVAEADEWIQDNELVLGFIHDDVKRVYPLQILVWHEIVNDEINGEPVLITYCPLCGSGIAYERTFDGEAVEFGTSGKLYNSNLVMYDRKTDTYWSQIDGKAIIGELTGQELVELSIDTVSWREWKKEHPDSEVLSQETGYLRDYGRDPYGTYYEDSLLFFPVENDDTNTGIHPKEVIHGIEIDGVFKAYIEKDLIENGGVIQDTINDVTIVVAKETDGRVTVFDKQGNEIVKERDFWFAWYAFHPDTLVWGK